MRACALTLKRNRTTDQFATIEDYGEILSVENSKFPAQYTMPFIDDDLLWCGNASQDNSKTMADLTTLACLDTTITLVDAQPTPVEGTLTELSHTDLHGLAPAPECGEESEDLLKSLSDSHLENIESIFADLEPHHKNLENLQNASVSILSDIPSAGQNQCRKRKRRKSADSAALLSPSIAPLQTQESFQQVQVKVEPGDLDGLEVYIKQEPSNSNNKPHNSDSDLNEILHIPIRR